ncbi:WhiB family transcriptional regulator [Streptomyces sp. NPDC000983]|uniref:WhiB family transcriptional regulator n=1 Tax=Streptomyces sp. NPDC000983 TaxID=3154373 RepID=UPI003322DD13
MSLDAPGRPATRAVAPADGGSRAWESSAACGQRDAELWFSRRSSSAAVAICASCPVLDACRAAVLQRERGLPRCRRQGVVAGLTGAQRHALDRLAGRQQAQDRRQAPPRQRTPDRRPAQDAAPARDTEPAPDVRPVAARRPAPPPGGDRPATVPAQPAPCGTRAAYQRHLRRGEPVDDACRAANARDAGRYRRTGSTRERADAARSRDGPAGQRAPH